MGGFPSASPVEQDLHSFVTQAAGIFKFTSFVVAFVNDGSDLPQVQLTISISRLGTSHCLRNRRVTRYSTPAERGEYHTNISQSILIPEDGGSSIQLTHTFLRDFLTSEDCSRNLFIYPPQRHLFVTIKCLQAICKPQDNLFYRPG